MCAILSVPYNFCYATCGGFYGRIFIIIICCWLYFARKTYGRHDRGDAEELVASGGLARILCSVLFGFRLKTGVKLGENRGEAQRSPLLIRGETVRVACANFVNMIQFR